MIEIKQGLDLPIAGAPCQAIEPKAVRSVALLGADTIALRPVLEVEVGERVRRGQTLYTDRRNPGVRYTAPAGGVVSAIHRGAQRALVSVVIAIDAAEDEEVFAAYEPAALAALREAEVRENLLASGLWTALRTRPYGKVPAADAPAPRAIFVNAMDTHPLAADPAVVIAGRAAAFAHGLTALARLAPKVYLCKAAGTAIAPGASGAQVAEFSGPHPAGLVGTHIHFLEPAGKQRTVWHLDYQDAIAIGRLFIAGRLDPERVIALGGPQVRRPRLVRTRLGAALDELLAGEVGEGENRVVSGSVLHGRAAAGPAAYLGRYHLQAAVLREGREQELLGWLRPGRERFSVFRLFSSHLSRARRFALTTTTGGEARPMVPIGTYEAVMPLDILATHLLRALIVGDTDAAQALGCLELDEEDLALCTFVCPGKYDYGPLLRRALDHIERAG